MLVLTDSELIENFRNPELREPAFRQIVQKYQQRLYWHIRKIVISHDDADDVLQNCMIKAWKGLAEFRGAAGLYTWLYRIATNEALTFLKQKRADMSDWQSVEYMLADQLESDALFDGDELEKKLQKAILSLPEKQRLVFNMKYYEDMKYEDMSKILKTSVGALKASYHHAVKKIEAIINND